jgi:UDPglucose 6-dehydrogenase
MHKIAVIGAGYVGLVTGACLASVGMPVHCYGIDTEKIAKLSKGFLPIYEPGLEGLISSCAGSGMQLVFTTDLNKAVANSDILFIAVNTPTMENSRCDLTHVYNAAVSIAGAMDGYKIIVMKSTVPVGTCRLVRQKIADELSRLGRNCDFDIVSNPEFLREGSAIDDFFNADRVVIGADNKEAAEVLKTIYTDGMKCRCPVLVTELESAEMIKYASNAFLACKISFINEIAGICEQCGADITDVSKGMGLDSRIGRHFLNPGPGFGGSCFPKDVKALAGTAESCGLDPVMLRSILKVNSDQTDRMIGKIEKAAGGLDGKTISVLGVSFKPGTDDIRYSPSVAIIKRLVSRNAAVRVFDPKALGNLKKENPELTVHYCRNPYSTCRRSDCIVLATEWNEFSDLDFIKLRSIVRRPVFLDLRNMYPPDYVKKFGFYYEGVGRK